MQHRQITNLTIRTLDDGQRLIEGICSTGSQDRQGDIVEPLGCIAKMPIPFMLDHDHSQAVGEITKLDVSVSGIKFQAKIAKIDTPGAAKEIVDRAYHLLRAGLRKFLSIGFRALEWEPLAGGGLRFLKWEMLEISAVAVPANADAAVTSVKAAHRSGVVRLSAADRAAAVVRSADGITRSTDLWAIATFDHLPSRRLTDHEKQIVRQFRDWNLKALDEKIRRAKLGIPERTRVVRLDAHDKALGRARTGATRVVRL